MNKLNRKKIVWSFTSAGILSAAAGITLASNLLDKKVENTNKINNVSVEKINEKIDLELNYDNFKKSEHFSETKENLRRYDFSNISTEKMNLIDKYMLGFDFDSLLSFSRGKDFEFNQEDFDQATLEEFSTKLKNASFEFTKNLIVEVIAQPLIEFEYTTNEFMFELIDQSISQEIFEKEISNFNENLQLNYAKNYLNLFNPLYKKVVSEVMSNEIINLLNVSSWDVLNENFNDSNSIFDELVKNEKLLSKKQFLKQFLGKVLINPVQNILDEKIGELVYEDGKITGERYAVTNDLKEQIENNNYDVIENYLDKNQWSISFVDFVYDFVQEIEIQKTKIELNENDFKFALESLIAKAKKEINVNISSSVIAKYFVQILGTQSNPNWEAILIETLDIYFEKNKDIFIADLISLSEDTKKTNDEQINWNEVFAHLGFSTEKYKQSKQSLLNSNLYSVSLFPTTPVYDEFNKVTSVSSQLGYSDIVALDGTLVNENTILSTLQIGAELDDALALVDGSFTFMMIITVNGNDLELLVDIENQPQIVIPIIPARTAEEEIYDEFAAIATLASAKLDYELDGISGLDEFNVESLLGISNSAFRNALSKLSVSIPGVFTLRKTGSNFFLDVKVGTQPIHSILIQPQSSATGSTSKALADFGFGWTATELGITWTSNEEAGNVDQITLNNKVKAASYDKTKAQMKTAADSYIQNDLIIEADFDTLLTVKFTAVDFSAMLQTFNLGGGTRNDLIITKITQILNGHLKTEVENGIRVFFKASTFTVVTQVILDLVQTTDAELAKVNVLAVNTSLDEIVHTIAAKVISNRLGVLLAPIINSIVLDNDGNPTGERIVLARPLETQITENAFEWLLREIQDLPQFSNNAYNFWINAIIADDTKIEFDTVNIIIGAIDIAEAINWFKSEFINFLAPSDTMNIVGISEATIEAHFADLIGTPARPNWNTVLVETRDAYFLKMRADWKTELITDTAKSIADAYDVVWEHIFTLPALYVDRQASRAKNSDPVSFTGEPTRRIIRNETEFTRVKLQIKALLTDKMIRDALEYFKTKPAMPGDPLWTEFNLADFIDFYLVRIDEADDEIDWNDFDSIFEAKEVIGNKIRQILDAPDLEEIIKEYYTKLGLIRSKLQLPWADQDELDNDAENPNKLAVIGVVKLEAIRVVLLPSGEGGYIGKIDEIYDIVMESVTKPTREVVAEEVEKMMKENFPADASELKDLIENAIFKFVFGNLYAPILSRASQIATEDNWVIQVILSEFEVNNAIANTAPVGTSINDKITNLDKYIENVAKYALRGKYDELLFEYIAQASEGRLTAIDAKTYYEITADKSKPTMETDGDEYPIAQKLIAHAEKIEEKIKKYLEDQYESFLSQLMKLTGATREDIIDYTSLPSIPTSFALLDEIKAKIGFVAIEGLLNAVKETGSKTWWVPLLGVVSGDYEYSVFGDYIKSIMYTDYKMWSITRDKFTEEMLKRTNAKYKEKYNQAFVTLSQSTTYVSHYFTPNEEAYTSTIHGQEFNKSTILWIGPNAIRFDFSGNNSTPVAISLAAQDSTKFENIAVFYSSAQYSAKNLTFKMITSSGETIYIDQRQVSGRKEIIFQRLKFVEKAENTEIHWLKSQKIRLKSWALFNKDYEIVQDNKTKLGKLKNFESRLESYFPADLEPIYVIEEPEDEGEGDAEVFVDQFAPAAPAQRPAHEWEDTKAVWTKFQLVRKGDSMEVVSESNAIRSKLLSVTNNGMSFWVDPGPTPIPWFVWLILGMTTLAEGGLVFALIKVIKKQRQEIQRLEDPASWNPEGGEEGYWAEDGNYYLYDNNNGQNVE